MSQITYTVSAGPGADQWSANFRPAENFFVLLDGLDGTTIVTLQMSPDGGTVWYTAKTYQNVLSNGMHTDALPRNHQSIFRIGVKSGEFGADPVTMIVGY